MQGNPLSALRRRSAQLKEAEMRATGAANTNVDFSSVQGSSQSTELPLTYAQKMLRRSPGKMRK